MRLARITDGLLVTRLLVAVYFFVGVVCFGHYAPNASDELVMILATFTVVLASAWTLGIPIALYAALIRAKPVLLPSIAATLIALFGSF